MREVIIYTTPTCPYCNKTKNWFKEHNVSFKEVNVAEDRDAAAKMVEESGQVGVPVWKIVENGETKRIVVGYDINALEEEFT
jgi:glutaredoxin